MDPADVTLFFVAVVAAAFLAAIPFSFCIVYCCPDDRHPEEERNAVAAAPAAQLAVAVDERRRPTAAVQARILEAEAAALDQAGRLEEAQLARRLAAAALELEQARRLATAPAAAAAAAEQARRLAAAQVVKKELGYFPYSAVVEGLRRGRRASGGDGERQLECAICLEVFVLDSTCSEVPACRHLFHRDCIEEWRKNGKSTCPLCRALIVPLGSQRLSAAEDMV